MWNYNFGFASSVVNVFVQCKKKITFYSFFFVSRTFRLIAFDTLSQYIYNIDLATAKSEALDNIYSLFKQNIKSCNAKRQRQRRRTEKKQQ